MKVVFVVTGVENIAVEFLSGFLKSKGHKADLVFDPGLFSSEAVVFEKLADFFDTKNELAKQVIEKQPDLICFSVLTLNYQRSLTLARLIKKINRNIPIVFGGIHPTCVPELVIKEKVVDIVCVGEGENALLELLHSIKNKQVKTNIRNLWFKKGKRIIKNSLRPLIPDLDKLPFPDKELFYNIYPGFGNDYYTISSRGCPFVCTYCANNILHKIQKGLGKPIRQRSVANIINELSLAKEKFSPKKITFVDDIFACDSVWLKNFVRLYLKKINLPYTMLTHPSFITNKTAKLLKSSGCYLLAFGIQSASEKTRFNILKRFETNNQIKLAAKACHKAKLNFSIDHIFNIPGEGIKEYDEALSFYNQLRPSIINSFWLQYFPKTEIVKIAVKKGIIKKAMVKKINEGKTSSSLVVGVGGKDDFSPQLNFTNFQFLFMLTPILPKWLISEIIKRKKFFLKFRPPMPLNISIKFFINLSRNRGNVYLGMIKHMIFFMRQSLKLKLNHS